MSLLSVPQLGPMRYACLPALALMGLIQLAPSVWNQIAPPMEKVPPPLKWNPMSATAPQMEPDECHPNAMNPMSAIPMR